MKRENIDGRQIYSKEIWEKMQVIGAKLIQLGYNEHKPNLFCKSFRTGFVYADLRGRKTVPLWACLALRLYYLDVPHWFFIHELITIKRADCPIAEYTKSFYIAKNHYYFPEIPTGLCKRCGRDILDEIKWEQIDKYKLNLSDELFLCKACKVLLYRENYIKTKENKRKYKIRHTCRLCGVVVPRIIKHHIRYVPEITILVCPACHGYIHYKCTFPHYLWEERRPVESNGKKVICPYCNKHHTEKSQIFRKHQRSIRSRELYRMIPKLYYVEIHLKHKTANIPLNDEARKSRYQRKLERRTYLRLKITDLLDKKHQRLVKNELQKFNLKEYYNNHYITEFL